jgi:transposase, IS30 family
LIIFGALMERHGRKRRLELESERWRLVMSGLGTVRACRLLKIGRKTGCRWRAQNGGLPPARVSEEFRSERRLSLLERRRIATMRRQNLGVREIAAALGRSPSTVSGELTCTIALHDRAYDADLAHTRAGTRPASAPQPMGFKIRHRD